MTNTNESYCTAFYAIGLTAQSSKRWHRMKGMAYRDEDGMVVRPHPRDDVPARMVPDFDDAGTLGCALELVREAFGHGDARDVNIERVPDGYCLSVRVWYPVDGAWLYDGTFHGAWLAGGPVRTRGCRTGLDRPTYAEAIAAALEAAPS